MQLLEHTDIADLKMHADNGTLPSEENARLASLAEGEKLEPEFLPQSPHEYTKLTILLNNRCNFSCSYCYSANGRCREELSDTDIDHILKYFIDPERVTARFLTFFISGGGEPLLSGSRLFHLLERIDAMCAASGFKYRVIIVTNGSLISGELIDKLQKYPVHLSVSFELTRAAQELHRGHYDAVKTHLRQLIDSGMIPSLTSTITPETVGCMAEMYRELCVSFPEVRHWSCTPVIDRRMDEDTAGDFFRSFTGNFFRISDSRKETDPEIGFPFYWRLSGIRSRFCPGKLCVNFHKDIVICPFASAPAAEDYSAYTYGRLDDAGQLIFDLEKYNGLMTGHLKQLASSRCSGCFLKLHCAGICHNRMLKYGENFREVICRFYRDFAAEYFFRRYDGQFRRQTGMSVAEFIRKEVEK